MYSFTTPLTAVLGIGPALAAAFAEVGLTTVKDVLLFIPLRYEDRSIKKTIAQLQIDEMVTLEAEVVTSGNFYKGRRSIQSATVKDDTGRLKLMWFNNPHVVARLQKGKKFLISGKLGDRKMMVQPVIEEVSNDSVHTNRLVPIYPLIPGIQPGKLRRILKFILDHLGTVPDSLSSLDKDEIFSLNQSFYHIHFPNSEDNIVSARERFALEELLSLIQHSHHLKEQWKNAESAIKIPAPAKKNAAVIAGLPFTLTGAQERCIQEILKDIAKETSMNRLLIGDVGSGKTAVAGVACYHVLGAGQNAALVAPTQILAEQHFATLQKLFPNLHIQLIAGKQKMTETDHPTLYIGTHAVLNKLPLIKPALLIYDEQHRFGVGQRSLAQHLSPRPHILTLSATPIPRTLMLSIFSHLNLSTIDEMPAGRIPVKTWLVPDKKREDGWKWIAEKIAATPNTQVLIVCPFINPSEAEGLDHVASATEMFKDVQKFFKPQAAVQVTLLHGRLPKKEQSEITEKLYAKEIQILVTTPIVEVGVDLPAATVIVIEAAERFGLASLHQMRGRVGRAGQAAYCLLFTNAKNAVARQRLKKFCETHNGLELAEQDLQRRGAGDIFGIQQHGFDDLQFASWTNLKLIAKAKQLSEMIAEKNIDWKPLFERSLPSQDDVPLAN